MPLSAVDIWGSSPDFGVLMYYYWNLNPRPNVWVDVFAARYKVPHHLLNRIWLWSACMVALGAQSRSIQRWVALALWNTYSSGSMFNDTTFMACHKPPHKHTCVGPLKRLFFWINPTTGFRGTKHLWAQTPLQRRRCPAPTKHRTTRNCRTAAARLQQMSVSTPSWKTIQPQSFCVLSWERDMACSTCLWSTCHLIPCHNINRSVFREWNKTKRCWNGGRENKAKVRRKALNKDTDAVATAKHCGMLRVLPSGP